MQVFFYAPDGVGERLQEAVEDLFPETQVYRAIKDLSKRFRHPLDNPTIAVLVARTTEDLGGILSIGDLLHDVRVLLVLPDMGSETVAKGHSLHPRFLSHIEGDLTEVAAVLEKMLKVSRPTSREEENRKR